MALGLVLVWLAQQASGTRTLWTHAPVVCHPRDGCMTRDRGGPRRALPAQAVCGRRPSVTTRCPRDRPARRLVARLAALRLGRGLRCVRAGSEASRAQAGEAASAQASVRLRSPGPGRSARRLGGLARIWRVSRPRAPFACLLYTYPSPRDGLL